MCFGVIVAIPAQAGIQNESPRLYAGGYSLVHVFNPQHEVGGFRAVYSYSNRLFLTSHVPQ
jgi:hypothetical protein